MPPGNQRTRIPAKVIERVTAEACMAIAQRVALARARCHDPNGTSAAEQIAQSIEGELLEALRLEHGPKA